jgi:hypothetical protein
VEVLLSLQTEFHEDAELLDVEWNKTVEFFLSFFTAFDILRIPAVILIQKSKRRDFNVGWCLSLADHFGQALHEVKRREVVKDLGEVLKFFIRVLTVKIFFHGFVHLKLVSKIIDNPLDTFLVDVSLVFECNEVGEDDVLDCGNIILLDQNV